MDAQSGQLHEPDVGREWKKTGLLVAEARHHGGQQTTLQKFYH